MRLFWRRNVIGAATLLLMLAAAIPSRADPQSQPERARFSEIFAQLAARLVGVVVNISTT